MNTRRYKNNKENENEIERTRLNKFQIDSINSIKEKLQNNSIKIETIIEECVKLDIKEDNTIHPDDLIDIIKSLLPSNTITRREFHYLILSLDGIKGHNINYNKLYELFPSKRKNNKENLSSNNNNNNEEDGNYNNQQEIWYDGDENGKYYHDDFADFDGRKGSIGEWLYRCACPAEIENYKTLIACLERFERESGLRISAQPNGFDIPLGPDLRAKIKFYTR